MKDPSDPQSPAAPLSVEEWRKRFREEFPKALAAVAQSAVPRRDDRSPGSEEEARWSQLLDDFARLLQDPRDRPLLEEELGWHGLDPASLGVGAVDELLSQLRRFPPRVATVVLPDVERRDDPDRVERILSLIEAVFERVPPGDDSDDDFERGAGSLAGREPGRAESSPAAASPEPSPRALSVAEWRREFREGFKRALDKAAKNPHSGETS